MKFFKFYKLLNDVFLFISEQLQQSCCKGPLRYKQQEIAWKRIRPWNKTNEDEDYFHLSGVATFTHFVSHQSDNDFIDNDLQWFPTVRFIAKEKKEK